VTGGFGHDTLIGGDGNDHLDGGPAPDTLWGGAGDDTLIGGSARDRIYGGEGNDVISPGTGKDVVDAGPGDDVIYANNGGADGRIDCGPGNDTLYIDPYNSPGGVSDRRMVREGRAPNCEKVIQLPAERDPARGVTRRVKGPWSNGNRTGTSRNDTLLGSHGSNVLRGLGGDDVIWGDALRSSGGARARRQRDRLYGGAGNDIIYGGRGYNLMVGDDGDDYIQGGQGYNVVYGGNGNDTIRMRSGGGGRVYAGPGADTVIAIVTRGRITVDCGPGEDLINISRFSNARLVKHRNCEKVKRG